MYISDYFIFSVNRLCRTVNRTIDSMLLKHRLSSGHFMIMMVVLENENAISYTEIAAIMDMDRSTVARNCEVLIRDGYAVYNVVESDKRRKQISLTSTGKQKIKSCMRDFDKGDDIVSNSWREANFRVCEVKVKMSQESKDPIKATMIKPSENLIDAVGYFSPIIKNLKLWGEDKC